MEAPQHVIVGALGAVLMLVTGSFLVSNWDELAGLADYRVTVTTDSDQRTFTGTQPADGQVRSTLLEVAPLNVTRLAGRLTWDDRTPPDERAQVTLRITTPNGRLVHEAGHASGTQGLGFDVALGTPPTPKSYHDTPNSAESRFAQDYPEDADGTGSWRFDVIASYGGDSPLGPGTVAWRLDAEWAWWSAVLKTDAAPSGR